MRTAATILVFLLLAGCSPKPGEFQGFETVEEDWGFGQTEARGICIFDGDDDGDNDVLLVRTGPNHYYENVDVGVFEERGAELGLDIDGAGTGCAAADFDQDGDVDIVVTDNSGPTRFLVGNGGGYWADASEFFFAGFDLSGQSSVTCEDVDHDGWLDLMLTGLHEGRSNLLRNRGDGTFEDLSDRLPLDGLQRSWAAAFLDADGDGLADLYLGTDVPPEFEPQADLFFRNDGDFEFTDVTADLGFPNIKNAMGIAVTDFDQDGAPDFYVTNIGHHSLYWNDGEGSFVDVSAATGTTNNTGAAGWGTLWVDTDDDGREELLVVNGGLYGDLEEIDGLIASPRQNNRFYIPHPASPVEFPEFRDRAGLYGIADGGAGMGAAKGDLDGDGRVDLIVASRGSSTTRVYRNLGTGSEEPSTAARIRLRGTDSNPEGVGATVAVEACGVTRVRYRSGAPSVLSQGEPALHFGVPGCDEDRHVTVSWASGAVTEHVLAPPNSGAVTVLSEDD